MALGYGHELRSGFRSAFVKTFNSTPGKSKTNDYIACMWIYNPIGSLVDTAADKGICLLESSERWMLDAQFAKLRKYFKCAIVPGKNKHLKLL